jgi:hypothetical protein
MPFAGAGDKAGNVGVMMELASTFQANSSCNHMLMLWFLQQAACRCW